MRSYLYLAVLVLFLQACGSSEEADKPLKVSPKSGLFEATISVSGELHARNSLDIQGPNGLRRANIWQVQITDLVEEGTRVKEGDYVATLDRTEASSKLNTKQSELDKTTSQHRQAVLDSTLTLRESRDQLINLAYAKEEAEITLAQSQFEPPAIIRQAEIALEQAGRAYEQAVENYVIKRDKEDARLAEIDATLRLQRTEINDLMGLLDKFEVRAPADGMITYERNWDGSRRGVGATISPWQNTVATLPDLSEMVSTTYVNEVDVSRIKAGQKVSIGIDAFPEKSFEGEVENVANIGEQRPNSDAKVFEVRVVLLDSDTTLRPGMTTSNIVVTSRLDSSIYVPTECIHGSDTATYVFVSKGSSLVKKEVITGIYNENETVIAAGLSAEDEIYLSLPKGNTDDAKWVGLDPEEKKKAQELLAEQKLEENKKIKSQAKVKKPQAGSMPPPPMQ
jgi:RND family efflux transporter MFP subunit